MGLHHYGIFSKIFKSHKLLVCFIHLTPYPRRGGVITPPHSKTFYLKENHVFCSCGEI